MSEVTVRNYGNYGEALVDGKTYVTFSLLGSNINDDTIWKRDQNNDLINNITLLGDHFNLNGFTVACHGHHNKMPNEVKQIVDGNSTLPQLLKKMVKIICGQGLGVYVLDESNGDTAKRKWITDKYPEVLNWLDSWDRDAELEPIETYYKAVAQDYFYMEGLYDQWLFNKSRRTGGTLPVRGLKFMNGVKCRLGKEGTISPHALIKDADCDSVLFTDWRLLNLTDVEAWPRFDRSNPFKYPSAVNYVRDRGFDEEIYSTPTWYNGLSEWIIGANRSPKYINSYLKNSLNAKIHIKIPNAWLESNQKILQDLCDQNHNRQTNGQKLITEYAGVSLVRTTNSGVEVPLEYTHNLLEALVNEKIKSATAVLSGAGENQGKAFWSRTFATQFGVEEWKFEEIPTKYSEFIKSLLEFDTVSQKRTLAGVGIDPAISNVGNDGIFNSGSQVYYAYLVFLDTQGFAEDYILEDLNRAARLNFPRMAKERAKLGFLRFAPPRIQETSPNDRFQNSMNSNPQNPNSTNN